MLVIDGVLQRVDYEDIHNGTFDKWEGITTIGEYAFESNLLVETLEIPPTIKEIRRHAFYHCESLKKINITDKTKKVGEFAFYKCKNLEYVRLPDCLKVIEPYTFAECHKLKEVNIPSSLTKIKDGAFNYCSKLNNINLVDSIEEIGTYCFQYCENLKSIKLPSGLMKIEPGAFSSCTSLKEIVIPENIKEIKKNTFYKCENLKKVKLPKNLKTIDDNAFYSCRLLKNITIPKHVEKIGKAAFYECDSIEKIYLPDNIKEIKEQTFFGCNNLMDISLSNNIETIGRNAFSNCINLTELIMPKNLETIESGAFLDCKNLKLVVLNDNLKSIQSKTFENCSSLNKVIFPKGIKDIRYSSFCNCENINEIVYDGISFDLNNVKYVFFDDVKDVKSKVIKMILILEGNYKPTHNIKFPQFFMTLLDKEELKKLMINENVKHFKEIYIKHIMNHGYNEDTLRDFYKFAYTLGCFSNEEVLINGKKVNVAQKASVFLKQLIDSGEYTIEQSHDLFDSLKVKKYNVDLLKYVTLQDKIDNRLVYENYRYLLKQGRTISRIINNFEDVMKTIVTDKEGRIINNPSLKKRIDTYLISSVFENIEAGNEDLAREFAKFHAIYQGEFNEAQDIRRRESYLKNIIGNPLVEENIIETIEKIKKEIDSTTLDSKKLIDNLLEKEFTYEWLDKHDPRNFTLGLYCDCCASIISVHYGRKIMEESIVRDDIQNLVIKNKLGEIIAKATIYVNKEQGYAVFNDIEMNRTYGNEMSQNDKTDNKKRIKIYNAFKRGVNAFVENYNANNKDKPITQVNVGWGFNRLKQVIKRFEEKSENVLDVPESFQDAKNEQWVVYKK